MLVFRGYMLFLAATDHEFPCSLVQFPLLTCITVMMILRVYAMWNRSKTILGALLFI